MKLKHYILSAFSDLLTKKDKADGPVKFDLLSAKDETKSHLTEKELSAIYMRDKMKHVTEMFLWPCNAFAICASLISKDGDYRLLISHNRDTSWSADDQKEVMTIGEIWRDFINIDVQHVSNIDISKVNSLLLKVFNYENLNKDISVLKTNEDFIKNLLKICLCADESFRGVSVLSPLNNTLSGRIAEEMFLQNEAENYQLSWTNRSFGSVHYKGAICQSGISINSITSKLAFVSPEIHLQYIERLKSPTDEKKDNFSILILPWPLKIARTDFNEVKVNDLLSMSDNFGFFTYEPSEKFTKPDILSILDSYYQEFDEIDLVVLPECALESSEADAVFEIIREYCNKKGTYLPTLISGVYTKGDETKYGVNALKIYALSDQYNEKASDSLPDRNNHKIEQKKHHRWFLDRSQLHNYKLGNRLSPKKKWWEYSTVDERNLISYYCEKNNLQITPLICEDLARQDPVAPVIRALGPNLIIALLLDGAQIKNRWPGRYASVLSEDPGSSVLTVSPLGMTLRSDGTGFPPSRVVAFWSEPGGDYKELALDKDKRAIVLTLEPIDTEQWSADGRKSINQVLQYAGHLSI